MVIPVKGYLQWGMLVLLFAAVVTATASANVRDAPHTVTARGRVFLRDGKTFFPVFGQAWSCPARPDSNNPSMTIADDFASLGINVVEGKSSQCVSNTGQTPAQMLDSALAERMLWVEKDLNSPPPTDLHALVDWQAPLAYPQNSTQLNCVAYSSLKLFNDLVALARKGPVLSWVAIGSSPSDGSYVCITALKVRNVFMTSLVGGVSGIGWATFDPRNVGIGNGFSVQNTTEAPILKTAQGLTALLSRLEPMLLYGARLKVSLPLKQTVRAAAWKYKGRVTVIAVNTSSSTATSKVKVQTGKTWRTLTYKLLKPLATRITTWKSK
jgi:hypothetical protein